VLVEAPFAEEDEELELEKLILEGARAGFSWSQMFQRREGFSAMPRVIK
jgi:3-methyladenine DNA glycosylase Tag